MDNAKTKELFSKMSTEQLLLIIRESNNLTPEKFEVIKCELDCRGVAYDSLEEAYLQKQANKHTNASSIVDEELLRASVIDELNYCESIYLSRAETYHKIMSKFNVSKAYIDNLLLPEDALLEKERNPIFTALSIVITVVLIIIKVVLAFT